MMMANWFTRLNRRTLAFAAALAVVMGFQLYHLFGLHVSKDLPLWDESAYIGWGDKFLQVWKVGSITNAPFYHILYAMVISVAGLLPGFYVMQYFLKLTLTLLVVLLVFRFARSAALSLLLGVFFAYSYYHLNIDVLVYYSALVPYLAAILVARRAPALSLGLSFLAGLGRLEYMAIPAVHFVFLIATSKWSGVRRRSLSWRSILAAVPAVGVWIFNIFVLTRVTVWQFHNRVWFAWSQNYAFFRYLTGRDVGGNPWLDHQTIAERDFPNAHSVSEAFAVNPTAVLEHTWFNLRELPGYLAGFADSYQSAGAMQHAPLFVIAAIVGLGLFALIKSRPSRSELAGGIKAYGVEIVLCVGGVIATAPGLIVSSKTNYIMALVPAALGAICAGHVFANRNRLYAKWSPSVLVGIAAMFAVFTLSCPPAYSAKGEKGPVYRDAVTMRTILQPFKGLKILGVSTASYVNYLGWKNGHIFIEPLAISPINRQATDLSLAGLIRANDPQVLLINSNWRSSASYSTAVEGFGFEGWDAHPLCDGQLYTKHGLLLRPVFETHWFEEEQLNGRVWRWSSDDADISLPNTIAGRPITVRFRMSSIVERAMEISLNGKTLFVGRLSPDKQSAVELKIEALPPGENVVTFHTDRPAVIPKSGDVRELAFSVENVEIDYGSLAKAK